MFSSITHSSSIAFIATAAYPLTPPTISHTSPTCFSFAHHAQQISPFSSAKKPAISPSLFAPPLMQPPATESRLRLMMSYFDDLSEFEPSALSSEARDCTAESADAFDRLVQKLPHPITFCHKEEIASLLLPEHAIQQEKSKETQAFLDQFTPEEKTQLKEKLMEINPKLTHWTAYQNAFLLVKAEVSKEQLGDYLSQQLGTFVKPEETHLFVESCFEKNQTSPKGFLLDLTPLMKLTAKHFLNETLLSDRHLKNLQQIATTDASIDQLFGNFFSFVDSPKKSTVFRAAGIMAHLKADDTFYWVQQKLAVSQNKLPEWLSGSEFLAAEKSHFEENILKMFREQGPSADITSIRQAITG
jgi:hypothetical protein